MSRFQNHLVVAAAVVGLAVTGSMMNSRQSTVQGAGEPVVSINPAQLPLPVVGSTTVSGTVGLAAGTTVGLASGSTVSLASGASVLVGNTVTDPVRVRNVNDAIQPVQVANSCTSPNLTLGCSIGPFFYHVPAGKRLVIEFVSMQVCSLPGQSASMNILTIVGGSGANHSSTETPPSTSPGTEFIGCNIPSASSSTAVGEQVHLYADPDTFISVGSSRDNNAGAAFFQFTMSGYLVEVPFTP